MEDEGTRWGDHLPGDPTDLFRWCLDQSQDVLLDLLAFLAALSIDAVQVKGDSPGSSRLTHADALAQALNLDMRQWWTPTAEGFYRRLSRTQLTQAVQEAGVLAECGNLAAMKKDEAARRTAKALAPTGWMPQPLRSPEAPVEAINEPSLAA